MSSSTAPFDDYVGTIGYDSHGNTTTLAGQELTYDAADRHLGTYHPDVSTATTSVVYQRDVFDRIIRRTETTPGGTTVTRYGYTGAGDSPDVTMDATGAIAETTMTLPGGALLTRGTSDVWSYPDIHGSISATADDAGVKQGPTRVYDPDGNPLAGLPDNAVGNFDYGWLGRHQRGVDHTPGLRPVIQMGARPYDPVLGRFLEVDPVEGGNSNDYDYCSGDPVGCTDLDGQWGIRIGPLKVGDGCPLGTNPNGSCRGGDTTRQIATGLAVVGAVGGAMACGASVVCGISVGAAATVTVYTAQHSGRQSFSWGGLGLSAVVGGATGLGGVRVAGAAASRAPFNFRLTSKWSGNIKFDSKVHRMRIVGNRPHWQVNLWQPTVRNSHIQIRIPVLKRYF